MSHAIDRSNDRDNVAYIGDKPWHGLGAEMQDDADLDQWRIAAGLNWGVNEHPVMYMDNNGTLVEVPNQKALVRDDTGFTLSIVGDGYNVVQPIDVIEFYRSLIEGQGFKMETAGSLMNGRRIWALARTGEEARIKGQDLLRQYIMLATGFDRMMATSAAQTSVRVVCWNTFQYAIGANGQHADVRVPHHSVYDAEKVKAMMGLETNAWSNYVDGANVLADRRVQSKEAVEYFFDLFYSGRDDVDIENKAVERRLSTMLEIYEGGVGQDTQSAAGTAWGLVNAVTRYADHERKAQSQNNRLNSAWFGDGERMKTKAWNQALRLVA